MKYIFIPQNYPYFIISYHKNFILIEKRIDEEDKWETIFEFFHRQ